MSEQINLEELSESLTGWDELAITKMFGRDLADLVGTQQVRAFTFIVSKREQGCDDRTAYDNAMSMPLKTLMAMYDVEPEPVPDDPITPAGKGDSSLARTPSN